MKYILLIFILTTSIFAGDYTDMSSETKDEYLKKRISVYSMGARAFREGESFMAYKNENLLNEKEFYKEVKYQKGIEKREKDTIIGIGGLAVMGLGLYLYVDGLTNDNIGKGMTGLGMVIGGEIVGLSFLLDSAVPADKARSLAQEHNKRLRVNYGISF